MGAFYDGIDRWAIARKLACFVLICGIVGPVEAQQIDTSLAYQIINASSGMALDVDNASVAAGANVVQASSARRAAQLWHFMPAGNSQYKIVNLNSGELLGIQNASKTSGSAALQWADNGTADHLWEVLDAGSGSIKLRCVNSGLFLGVAGASTSAGAGVVQTNDDTAAERWNLMAAGNAYPDPAPLSGDATVHDPSMIQKPDGTYLVFGTHGGLEMRSSADGKSFSYVGHAFSSVPGWTTIYSPAQDLWAPDISYRNGKYWLYYAASGFGSNLSAIGLATSDSAAPSSFVDQGTVYSSDSRSVYNAIDPGLFVDGSGQWWLVFGSWSIGISIIHIDPATGKQASWSQTRMLVAQRPASPAIEGAYVYPHGGYYYLFASFDTCCAGTNSTYHIAVGRSTSPTGPYSDRGGIPMTSGGGTILLGTHGRYIGPGGETVMHDENGDFLVYHYYDAYANGSPALGISKLGWDAAGWPYLCAAVVSGAPAHACAGPSLPSSVHPR